jgi:hypothetical protein
MVGKEPTPKGVELYRLIGNLGEKYPVVVK